MYTKTKQNGEQKMKDLVIISFVLGKTVLYCKK